MTLLFETPLTRVFYEAGTSDYSLITFAPFEDEFFNDDKNFWGSTFTRKNNVNCLALSAKSPHWYPQSEINLILEKLKAFEIHIPNAVAYGASMGGYAALKYGKAFGADMILAFSPQYSICADDLDFSSIYTKRYVPHLHQNMSVQSDDLGDKNFIFYDSKHLEDRNHFKKIYALNPSNVTGVKADYLGHKTIYAVTGTQKMNHLIQAIFQNNILDIRKTVKDGRKDVSLYYGILAKENHKKRPLMAYNIAKKGLSVGGRTEGIDVLHFVLSLSAQRKNEFSLAMYHAIKAQEHYQKDAYVTNIEGLFHKKRQFLDDDAVKAYYNFNDAAKQDLTDNIKKKLVFF